MPAKPTTMPKWASSSGNVLEPTEGKKALGYLVSERPPAAWWNWWKNLVWKWLLWNTASNRAIPWYQATSIASTTYDWQIAFAEGSTWCRAGAITVWSGTRTIRWSQDGGLTWTVISLDAGVASSTAQSIASNGTRVVIVGMSGLIQYSTTAAGGFTAATPAAGFTGNFYQVIWAGNQFVAVGDSEVQTSSDGINWIRRQSVAPTVTGRTITSLGAVAYAGGRLVRVGANNLGGGEVFYSDDNGATWTWWYTTPNNTDALAKVIGTTFADGSIGFAASPTSGQIYYSLTGNWAGAPIATGTVNFAFDDMLVVNQGAFILVDQTTWQFLPGGGYNGVARVLTCAQSRHGFALVGRITGAAAYELARTPVQRVA